jgi:hypothetical protein
VEPGNRQSWELSVRIWRGKKFWRLSMTWGVQLEKCFVKGNRLLAQL